MRAIRVKLDENLGLSHLEALRRSGYSAERVPEEGLSGAPDEIVWQRVCEEGCFFLTLDIGFADIRRFPPGSHPGIIVLRPSNKGRDAITGILVRFLQEYDLEDLKGCLVVVDEKHVRIRRPSQGG